MVYQEQIMRIGPGSGLVILLGEADLLAGDWGKKKGLEMQKHRHQFVGGCTPEV